MMVTDSDLRRGRFGAYAKAIDYHFLSSLLLLLLL